MEQIPDHPMIRRLEATGDARNLRRGIVGRESVAAARRLYPAGDPRRARVRAPYGRNEVS